MNWLNAFELMCYIIVAIMLIDLVRKKDFDGLFTFGAAALVGYFMELAAGMFLIALGAILVTAVGSLMALGLVAEIPWFFTMGLIFTVGTVYVAISEREILVSIAPEEEVLFQSQILDEVNIT